MSGSVVAAPYIRDGHTGVAVFEAIKVFEERLHGLSGSGLDGSKLVTEILSDREPQLMVADLATETGRNLHSGVRSLAAGLVSALRNPGAYV